MGEPKRKELFRALTGSWNYNLNGDGSDKDWKVFVAPTFEDLYFNKQYSHSIITPTEDIAYHDIRKIPQLFFKSNINFTEVLFSNETAYGEGLDSHTEYLISKMFSNRDRIAKINLPYLYDACVGMHNNKKNNIDKGTESTQVLVDKYGFETKNAMHSMRVLSFLTRFAGHNFNDFKDSIYYSTENGCIDVARSNLLNIKHGCYSKEEFLEHATGYLDFVEKNYKEQYKSQPVDNEMNEMLNEWIMRIVRDEVEL